MSTNRTAQNVVHTITNIPQQIIHYISGAVTRIFGPTVDNYPEIGLQPFEGDPADKKSF